MVWKVVVGAVVGIVVALAAVGLVGRRVWNGRSEDLLVRLSESTHQTGLPSLQLSALDGLPQPVQRYLSLVLGRDAKAVESARISHSGTFNMGTDEPQWRPFSSTQDVAVAGPGFLWNARIRMAPGMPARVHDAYVNGHAILTARLFGLITVMESPHSPELAQGELLRFLAEAPWYPTVFVQNPALTWTPVNDRASLVTLVDGDITVSLEVRFGADGLIESVYTDGRFRDVDGAQVKVPWEGRFWNYEERDGMLIPLDGEVAWLLPEARWPYWRGHIDEIAYEFAE